MLKRQKKKLSGEYPTFAFRVSKEDKLKITKLIDDVTDKLNSKLGEDDFRLRKNDVIVEALNIGLKKLKGRK